MKNPNRPKGFSLIELMITVAIIGILAAVAYPAYTNSLVKGSRANAKTLLMEIVQKEQQYLLDARSYAATVGALQVIVPPEFSNFYTVSITLSAGPPPGFQARATPIAGKRQEPDGWLEINQTGLKTSQYPDKW